MGSGTTGAIAKSSIENLLELKKKKILSNCEKKNFFNRTVK